MMSDGYKKQLQQRLKVANGLIDAISETFAHEEYFDPLRLHTSAFRKQSKAMHDELERNMKNEH